MGDQVWRNGLSYFYGWNIWTVTVFISHWQKHALQQWQWTCSIDDWSLTLFIWLSKTYYSFLNRSNRISQFSSKYNWALVTSSQWERCFKSISLCFNACIIKAMEKSLTVKRQRGELEISIWHVHWNSRSTR